MNCFSKFYKWHNNSSICKFEEKLLPQMTPHPNRKKYRNYQNSSKSREETERNCLINKAKSQDCNGLLKKKKIGVRVLTGERREKKVPFY